MCAFNKSSVKANFKNPFSLIGECEVRSRYLAYVAECKGDKILYTAYLQETPALVAQSEYVIERNIDF